MDLLSTSGEKLHHTEGKPFVFPVVVIKNLSSSFKHTAAATYLKETNSPSSRSTNAPCSTAA